MIRLYEMESVEVPLGRILRERSMTTLERAEFNRYLIEQNRCIEGYPRYNPFEDVMANCVREITR